MLKNVELHGLSEGSALADGNNITFRNIYKARGAVSCQLVMALFESTVDRVGNVSTGSPQFLNIMKLLTYGTWEHTGGNLGEQ